MKFIGFNFTKIHVERFSNKFKDLKINNKIDISTIEQIDQESINKDEKIVKIKFTYDIVYNPKLAKINLSGEVFISDNINSVKNLLKEWEKNKQINEDFNILLFNIILRKCNLKALELEDEMNLPLHMPFPSVKKGK